MAGVEAMTRHEALAVGWAMTPRGEMGLIVSLTALTAGVIADALFLRNRCRHGPGIGPARAVVQEVIGFVAEDRRRAQEAAAPESP